MSRDLHHQGSSTPPYQVDYHNEACGKTVSATKRRIVWRFGFANDKAIADGQTGNNCRGVEHEVSVIWSLTSGKRQVAFDGREIHFSKATESKLEMTWTMQGGHIVKVVAHATPPLRAIPGFRQFDFLLDGMSYFDMAKIFELGTPAMNRRVGGGGGHARSAGGGRSSSSSNHYNYSNSNSSSPHRHNNNADYDNDDQRSFASAPLPTVTPEKSMAAARPTPATAPPTRAASMPASSSAAAAAVVVETVDLLALPMPASGGNDLLSTPIVSQQQHQPQQPLAYHQSAPVTEQPPQQQYNGYHQPQIQQGQQPVHYQQQQGQHQPQQQYAQSRVDEFAPLPPPPRTFQDVSNSILSNYGPDPNAPLALANAPHYDDHAYQNSMSSALIADAPPQYVTPEKRQPLTLKPTMEPVSIAELEAREHEQQYSMSELERAMKSIVNLDDITETVETPEQAKQQRLKEANKPIGRSKPKPAATPAWNLGLNPALKDIKEHAAPQKSEPTREIMRTHHHTFDPAAAQAGMMVIYGASPPPTGGMIPAVQGFGAGVHASYNNNPAYHPQQQHQQQRQQQVMYAAY